VDRRQRGEHADRHPFERVAAQRAVVRHHLGQALALDVLTHDVRPIPQPSGVDHPGHVGAGDQLGVQVRDRRVRGAVGLGR
jgi:hypothetical protein